MFSTSFVLCCLLCYSGTYLRFNLSRTPVMAFNNRTVIYLYDRASVKPKIFSFLLRFTSASLRYLSDDDDINVDWKSTNMGRRGLFYDRNINHSPLSFKYRMLFFTFFFLRVSVIIIRILCRFLSFPVFLESSKMCENVTRLWVISLSSRPTFVTV